MPALQRAHVRPLPGRRAAHVDYGKLQKAIEAELGCGGLQVPGDHPQVHPVLRVEADAPRQHARRPVARRQVDGVDGALKAMSRLHKEGVNQNDGQFQVVKPIVINPKAVRRPTCTASTTCRPSSGPTACSPR